MCGTRWRPALCAFGVMLLCGCISMETGVPPQEPGSRGELRAADQLLFRQHTALTRRKRSILLPSGVKLCSQDTLEQAVNNHLNFFHLRVCQETIWEAFKIFWGQLPERSMYQDWVSRCMDGTVSIMETGRFFSQSEEHLSLIRTGISMVNMNSSFSPGPRCSSSEASTVQTGESDTTADKEVHIMGSETTTDQGDISPDYAVTATEGLAQEAPATALTDISVDSTSNPTEFEGNTVEVSTQTVTHGPQGGDKTALGTAEEEEAVESEKIPEIISEDMDVPDPDVIQEGPEPPTEVVVEEVLRESVVLQESTTHATEAVTVEKDELSPTTAEDTVVLQVKDMEDMFLSTNPDIALTGKTDVTSDATIFLITDSDSEESKIFMSETPEPDSVSEVETEVFSKVSIPTTSDKVSVDISEGIGEEKAQEDRLTLGSEVTSESVVAILQNYKDELNSHVTEDIVIETEKLEKKVEVEYEGGAPVIEGETAAGLQEDVVQTGGDVSEIPEGDGTAEEPMEEIVEIVQEPEPVETNEPTEGAAKVEEQDKEVEGGTAEPKVTEQHGGEGLENTEEGSSKEEVIAGEPEFTEEQTVGKTLLESDGKITPVPPEVEGPPETTKESTAVKAVIPEPPEVVTGTQTTSEVEPPEENTQDSSATLADNLGNNGFGLEDKQAITIGNEVDNTLMRSPRPLKDQVVELSIKLRGETYNNALRSPSSFQYQQLARHFTRKIEDTFKTLPGFKNVYVVEFRPQKDLERGLVVLVRYAITLEVDAGGIANETLDFISRQNNLVEKNYPGAAEQPTVVYTITDFRNYITEALHKDNFMTNSSLQTQDELPENEENLLPSAKPTSQAADAFASVENVLAAEKPPHTPSHETDSNVFLKKDDFLFGPFDLFDPWKGAQSVAPSENDVIVDESMIPTLPAGLRQKTGDLQPGVYDYHENIKDKTPRGDQAIPASSLIDPQTGTEDSMDDWSGSTFSGDDQEVDLWSLQLVGAIDGRGSLDPGDPEILPPPDMEETGDEDEDDEADTVASESPTGMQDGFIVTGVEITTTPLEITLPTFEKSKQVGSMDEPILDQILLTPHITTDLRYSTATPAPMFYPKGTLTVELSLQTVEASGIYDESSLTDILVGAPELPESWTLEAPAFTGPTDTVVKHEGTTKETDDEEETPEAATSGTIPKADTSEEDMVHVVEPEVPDSHTSPTVQVPTFIEVQPVTGRESSFNIVIEEPSDVELLTEENEQLLPETQHHDEIEILEDLITTITAAPVQTSSSVSSDHSNSIAFLPEEDSPFTRVSDSAPEDEELIYHEDPNHEDEDLVYYEDPINEDEDVPTLAPSGVKTERPTSYAAEMSPGVLSQGEGLGTTFKGTSEEKGIMLQTPASSFQETNDSSPTTEIQVKQEFSDIPSMDVTFDVFQLGGVGKEGDNDGFSSGVQGSDLDAIALPTRPGRALMVFFRLRVTNMAFSRDLFNKSSTEYKELEERFLQLLVPYLQSNLNNFQNLEILNFRNGSIVVNSRMRFGRPVPRSVTNVVYLILEDFANTAYQTMNLAIDKHSLDVESGDKADPCKFQACNEFSRCMVNRWSGEAECVCDAGYLSVDGLPCRSVCEARADFCLNDGKCDVIPGEGAICRCRVGENWWYRGKHCEEFVSEPLLVGIAIAMVMGFLVVSAGIIFFLSRMLREQYDAGDSEDPTRRGESNPKLERVAEFASDGEPVSARSYSRLDDERPRYHGGYEDTQPPYYWCLDPDPTRYSVGSLSTDDSVDQNYPLTTEEIQERLKIIELCCRGQPCDFARQTHLWLERRGSSTT